MRTIDAAAGKWRGILIHFGLPEQALRNIHQPCPLCSGHDRYRFDDKDGSGSYFCSGCGPGRGMDLVMKFTGLDFRQAAKEIDSIVGNVQLEAAKDKPDASKRIRHILENCRQISSGDPVHRYLIGRGLPVSRALLFHPSLAYYEDGNLVDRFPAMVARIQNSQGELAMLHLTHLDGNGGKANVPSVKKYTGSMGSTLGAHIRLTQIYPKIGIAEGIETALAVMKIHNIPCWAAGSANFMETFKAPEGVSEVVVFSDNDENFRGQSASYTLANRLRSIQGVISDVLVPTYRGDFADALEAVTGAKDEINEMA